MEHGGLAVKNFLVAVRVAGHIAHAAHLQAVHLLRHGGERELSGGRAVDVSPFAAAGGRALPLVVRVVGLRDLRGEGGVLARGDGHVLGLRAEFMAHPVIGQGGIDAVCHLHVALAGRVARPGEVCLELGIADCHVEGLHADHIRKVIMAGILADEGLHVVVDLRHDRAEDRREINLVAAAEIDVVAGVVGAHGAEDRVGVDAALAEDAVDAGLPVVLELVQRLLQRLVHGVENLGELIHGLGRLHHLQQRRAEVAGLRKVFLDLVHAGDGAVLAHRDQRGDVGVAHDVVRAEVDRHEVGLRDRLLEHVGQIGVERLGGEGVLAPDHAPETVVVGVDAVDHVAQLHGAERAAAELVEVGVHHVGEQIVVSAIHALKRHGLADAVHGVARGDAVADAGVGLELLVLPLVHGKGGAQACHHCHNKQNGKKFTGFLHFFLLFQNIRGGDCFCIISHKSPKQKVSDAKSSK